MPLTVTVTGAAGQIAYSLVPLICNGTVFGPDTRVDLRLLDVPFAAAALEGVRMEIEDGAYSLVNKLVCTTDVSVAFAGTDVAILLGGFPRKAGMERKELIAKNTMIFKEHGEALEKYASCNCKVLVVANPANTNCLIASMYAPSIPRQNFTCLTRLDQNRAVSQIALKADCAVDSVSGVIIWGNHSSTQYPDVNHSTIFGVPVRELLDDDYLDNAFVATVQKRGAAIIEARKLSSAMSAANAIKDHIRDWLVAPSSDKIVSMGVMSDGAYGIRDLCYSFPVRCTEPGKYTIVELTIDARSQALMDATRLELEEERAEAIQIMTNLPSQSI
jgi:malate/lactate dehydrogenase